MISALSYLLISAMLKGPSLLIAPQEQETESLRAGGETVLGVRFLQLLYKGEGYTQKNQQPRLCFYSSCKHT